MLARYVRRLPDQNLTGCRSIANAGIHRRRIESRRCRDYGDDTDAFRPKQKLWMRAVHRRRRYVDVPVASSVTNIAVSMHNLPIATPIQYGDFSSVVLILVKANGFVIPMFLLNELNRRKGCNDLSFFFLSEGI